MGVSPKQRHTSRDAGTVELCESQGINKPLSFTLCIRDSCRCNLLPFDCSHSRAGISNMLNRMSLNLPLDYVIWTQVLPSTRLNNDWYDVWGFWHPSLQAIWPCSQSSLPIFHYSPTLGNLKARSANSPLFGKLKVRSTRGATEYFNFS